MSTARPKKILMFAKKDAPANANILEDLSKAGFTVDLETDPNRCHEKLQKGYYHLAILPKEFLKGIPPPENGKCYPRVKKWRLLRYREYESSGARNSWLERYGFLDEVSPSLEEIRRKLRGFFEDQYRDFGWGLVIAKGDDPYSSSPFQPWGLLADIAPEMADSWAKARVEELEDLLRFLYPDDHKIMIFYPALWVEDGLAAIETWAIKDPNDLHVKRSLLLIGKEEAVNRHIKNHETCGEDSIQGTIQLQKKHFINGFGAVTYRLYPISGTERLYCITDLLARGHDVGSLAEKMIAFYKNAPEGFFRPRLESVKVFETIRAWLELPDVETISQRVIENLRELTRHRELQAGIHLAVDCPPENKTTWRLKTREYEFDLDTDALKEILIQIFSDEETVQAESSPGKLHIRRLLIEKNRLQTIWVSDYRIPDIPACRLSNLTQLEAELRYELGGKLPLLERLELEKALIGVLAEEDDMGDAGKGKDSGDANYEAAAIKRAVISLYKEPNNLNGARGLTQRERRRHAAMLLHVTARLVNIQGPVLSKEKIIETFVLMYSASLLTSRIGRVLQKWPGDQPLDLKLLDLRLHTCRLAGQVIKLTKTRFNILEWLTREEGRVLTYDVFLDEIIYSKQKDKAAVDLYHQHISGLRKQLEDAVGYEIGKLLIVSYGERSYKLDTSAPDTRSSIPDEDPLNL